MSMSVQAMSLVLIRTVRSERSLQIGFICFFQGSLIFIPLTITWSCTVK